MDEREPQRKVDVRVPVVVWPEPPREDVQNVVKHLDHLCELGLADGHPPAIIWATLAQDCVCEGVQPDIQDLLSAPAALLHLALALENLSQVVESQRGSHVLRAVLKGAVVYIFRERLQGLAVLPLQCVQLSV